MAIQAEENRLMAGLRDIETRLRDCDRMAAENLKLKTGVMPWQSMASAPRDGRDVLLAFWTAPEVPCGPYRTYRVCQWDELENVGWLYSDNLDEIDSTPTHWLNIDSPT